MGKKGDIMAYEELKKELKEECEHEWEVKLWLKYREVGLKNISFDEYKEIHKLAQRIIFKEKEEFLEDIIESFDVTHRIYNG